MTARGEPALLQTDTLYQAAVDSGFQPPAHDPRLLWGLERTALMHRDAGRLEAAVSRLTLLLEVMRRDLGADAPLLVGPLNTLAAIRLHQGDRLHQARKLLETALAIVERNLGPLNLLTIRTLEQLATVHERGNRPIRASRLLRRVAETREHALRANSPGEALALAWLGQHHLHNDRAEMAAPLLAEAKDILMEIPGPYHAARAEVLQDLSLILEERQESENAQELLKSALAITENMRGSDHPVLIPMLNRTARLHQKLGKPALGRAPLQRALGLSEKKYGPDHFITATVLLALAENLRMENQPDPAIPLYNRAMASLRQTGEPGQLVLAQVLTGLARSLQVTGRTELSERNQREALQLKVKTLGSQHETVDADRRYHAELVRELENRNHLAIPEQTTLTELLVLVQERLSGMGFHLTLPDSPQFKVETEMLDEAREMFGMSTGVEVNRASLMELLAHLPPVVPKPAP